jgi:predicted Zn-dependent peptidase
LLFRFPLVGDNLCRVLDVLGGMLFRPSFAEFILRERRVVLEEASEKLPFPIERQWRRERGKMFWGSRHRLARFLSPCGSPPTIRAITVDDLRSWHARHYVPCNVNIVACGGLTLDALRNSAADSPIAVSCLGLAVEPLPSATIVTYQPRRHVIKFSDHVKAPINHGKIEVVVPHLRNAIATPAIARACEAINESVFRHVRERLGGDYDLSASALEHPEGFELTLSGNFPVALVSKIEQLVDESLALAEDATLIQRFIDRAVNEYQLLDMNGQDVVTAALTSLADERRIVTIADHVSRARALTVADVQDVVRAFAPERRWTLLCTP